MELFYSREIISGLLVLDGEESNHCIRVLRHREGDVINIIDGCGTLYECEITCADAKAVAFRILERRPGYGAHPYVLQMAVAPPKNIDRFEWFAEKATEIGVDEITPLSGDYSLRRDFRSDRIGRILVSAAKQSHKGAVPVLDGIVGVRDFIASCKGVDALKLICFCGQVESLGAEKKPITECLSSMAGRKVIVMIGPEGDFSQEEVAAAVAAGWQVTSLGESRLRIETAALTAVAAVYLENM